jgi:hypothetical protein
MSDGSSDEEDYDAFEDVADAIERRYPLHDCVEFEDVETLRVSANGALSTRCAARCRCHRKV